MPSSPSLRCGAVLALSAARVKSMMGSCQAPGRLTEGKAKPWWSVNGQVRVAAGGEASSCVCPGLAHAERLSFGDYDDRVMQEPVEQADGRGVLGQEPAPLVEGPMRADPEGAALVGGGEPEQQLGAGVVEWREAGLVDNDQVVAEQVLYDAAGGVVGQAAVEGLDEVGGGEVADLASCCDGGGAERDQAVISLSRPGRRRSSSPRPGSIPARPGNRRSPAGSGRR
jgi:hypothetical protein